MRYSGTASFGPWRTAYATEQLVTEVDALFPNRPTVSDGTIASGQHSIQNPSSDHEARDFGLAVPVVLAVDITSEGETAQSIIDLLMFDERVRYIIHDGEMIRSYKKGLREPWERGAPYTGSNPHRNHIHVSWVREVELFDNADPFGSPEEDVMRIGDTGNGVRRLQVYLNRWAEQYPSQVANVEKNHAVASPFPIDTDGVFGGQTEQAIDMLQLHNDLPATGETDADTNLFLSEFVSHAHAGILSEETIAAMLAAALKDVARRGDQVTLTL